MAQLDRIASLEAEMARVSAALATLQQAVGMLGCGNAKLWERLLLRKAAFEGPSPSSSSHPAPRRTLMEPLPLSTPDGNKAKDGDGVRLSPRRCAA